ncbi:MAG TPA: tetratricopeptide repeat protein [Spirochaetota bacterium]|nr:tetratricopeptide repeat protein [Spirochaetota bacterium]
MKVTAINNKFNSAVQLEKDGHYEAAQKEYISIITADPSFRPAYVNLGSLYSRMNHFAESIRCFEAALTLGRDYITYFNIGCTLYKMNEYSKALASLQLSVSLNKQFALSKLVAGLCHSRLNNLTEAEKYFCDVLKIWPNNRVSLTALAIIYYNTNKYDYSLQLLNRILYLDAGNIKLRELKSNILLKTGRIDETVKEIKIIKQKADGYRYFDEFIKSIPVESLTDKYGTIDSKIDLLKNQSNKSGDHLISLSLCHLFKGETDTAIDYLFRFKKNFSN